MSEGDYTEKPKPATGDAVHSGIKAALSIIPGAAELFDAVIYRPIDRRREQWILSIAYGLGH